MFGGFFSNSKATAEDDSKPNEVMKAADTPEGLQRQGTAVTVSQDTVRDNGKSNLAVRVRPYSGVELKTLWNHFNKDDLITSSELSSLLERVLIKDASDILIDLKSTAGWKKYVQSGIKVIDTSKGNTIDLSEFTAEFNGFNTHRFYYIGKYVVPEVISLLQSYSKEMNIAADKLLEFGNDESVLLADRAKMKELEKLVQEYQLRIKSLEESQSSGRNANTSLLNELDSLRSRNTNLERAALDMQKDDADLRRLVESTQSVLNDTRKQLFDSQNVVTQLRLENQTLESQIVGFDALQQENESLRRDMVQQRERLVLEWKSCFQSSLEENGNLRELLSQSKTQITTMNTEILKLGKQIMDMQNETAHEGPRRSKLYAAAITGVQLDPFREQLVRQFGSIDSAFSTFDASPSSQLRKSSANDSSVSPTRSRRITLNEVELLASSLGYSRQYAKKLYFALDFPNKGILSVEQFSKPLPVLNRQLILLTKDAHQSSS